MGGDESGRERRGRLKKGKQRIKKVREMDDRKRMKFELKNGG